MIKIYRFTFDDQIKSPKAFFIRTKVFVEEQQVDPDLEYDGYDDTAQHYLLEYNNKAVGTARWRNTEKGIKLERFALLPEYRNKRLGSELLKEVLKDVVKLNEEIYLHSQIKAIPYYERVGFIKEGEMFIEAGIKHFLMKFNENY